MESRLALAESILLAAAQDVLDAPVPALRRVLLVAQMRRYLALHRGLVGQGPKTTRSQTVTAPGTKSEPAIA